VQLVARVAESSYQWLGWTKSIESDLGAASLYKVKSLELLLQSMLQNALRTFWALLKAAEALGHLRIREGVFFDAD
jgi:hypothetical protein